MKVGRPYVAIDPSASNSYIKFVLEDTGATTLLSDSRNHPRFDQLLGGGVDQQTLNIEDLDDRLSEANPGISVSPDADCILFYTSGSTGRPKGVRKIHRNILHTTAGVTNDLNISANDRISLLVSLSFAASRFGIAGALLNGGTLCPFDIKMHGLGAMLDWLATEGITVFHTLPSTFRSFLQSLEPSTRLQNVRLNVLGGEPLTATDLGLFRRHFSPECILVNTLGATECGVVARYHIQPNDPVNGEQIPVGYPIRDKQVLILDENRAELPPGEVGQIAVRSRFMSPGYWKDEPLTATKFLPDPEGGDERIYLTGDLGKLRADGLLEHLGRSDSQVKIRGYRVEPGQIEAALRELEAVRQAAVVARRSPNGEPWLVGYVVPRGKPGLLVGELRRQLRDELPEYMIPARFVELVELPLTPAGKLDKQALPEPQDDRSVPEADFERPKEGLEAELAVIWEDILAVQPVGRTDDFFDLGGESLLAMRLFARIEKQLGKQLPLASLFRASTLASQATLLAGEAGQADWPNLAPVQTRGSRPAFFCVSPPVVDVLAYRELALEMGLDQPFYALYSHGLRRPEGASRVGYEAARYLEELRAFQPSGPYYLGGYSNGGRVALEMAHQLIAHGEQVPVLVMLETYGPHYLRRDPRMPLPLYRGLRWLRRAGVRLENFTPWLVGHARNLWELDWPGRMAYLSFKLRRRGQWLNRWMRSRDLKLRPALRDQPWQGAIPGSYLDYQPPQYGGKVVLFQGDRQPWGIQRDKDMGWHNVLIGEFEIHQVPGDHQSILFGPRLAVLAEKLTKALAEVKSSPDRQAMPDQD
jgi:amino acid adenylation domain-containing protein